MLVLVVEDDASVSRFLVRGLREEGYLVDTCAEGGSALSQAMSQPYDLILLDWALPEIDGLSLLRAWRDKGLTAPILMLTARAGVEATVLALDAGADDHLSKPFSFEELLARARALVRRSKRAEGALGGVSIHGATLDLRARVIERGSARHELSAREFALLDFFLQRRGEVLSRARILDRVWGMSHDPTTNVVDVYVRYLRNKIDPDPAPEGYASAIETVRGRGYRLRLEGERVAPREAEGAEGDEGAEGP
jgi:DNA-binding response OmpR family regulator